MGIMVHYGRLISALLLLICCINSIEADYSSSELGSLFFRLYTGETMNDFHDEKLSHVNTLACRMNRNKPTVIYIHGEDENVESSSVDAIVNAYLQRGDHNVIAADYRVVAKNRDLSKLEGVGEAFAEALETMTTSGFEITKLHIVGFSLGAQLSGYIGRSSKLTIPRITGLDPAGPYYDYEGIPLSANDAEFVDIIHTDAGMRGTDEVVGTVDFFPNGGNWPQLGCHVTFIGEGVLCGHQRAWKYYAESLAIEKSFVAVKCSSSLNFYLGLCRDNEKGIMGYATSVTSKDKFYLETNYVPPYGQN